MRRFNKIFRLPDSQPVYSIQWNKNENPKALTIAMVLSLPLSLSLHAEANNERCHTHTSTVHISGHYHFCRRCASMFHSKLQLSFCLSACVCTALFTLEYVFLTYFNNNNDINFHLFHLLIAYVQIKAMREHKC